VSEYMQTLYSEIHKKWWGKSIDFKSEIIIELCYLIPIKKINYHKRNIKTYL